MQITFSVRSGRHVMIIVIIICIASQSRHVALRHNPFVESIVVRRPQSPCSQISYGGVGLLVAKDVSEQARVSHVDIQAAFV